MIPEEISKKANEERAQQKPVRSRKKNPETGATHDAFAFYTWSKIFPGRFNFMLWFMLLVPATVFFIIYFSEDDSRWALYTGSVFVSVFLFRWLYDFIQRVLGFGAYKTFRDSLGFRLKGWETLGTFPKQLDDRYWSVRSKVEIFLHEFATAEQKKLVQDAVFLFMSAANKKFYEAEPGGDGRVKWGPKNAIKVYGSSDAAVIGEMYRLIHVYLRSIHQRYPVISSVNITFDPEIIHVSPPQHTDV